MRLPCAYSLEEVNKINRVRIIRGVVFTLFGLLVLRKYTYPVGPGTVALTPLYCLGALLVFAGTYFLWVGLTKKPPHFIFRVWPALRTPVKSLKKFFRETWEFLTEE